VLNQVPEDEVDKVFFNSLFLFVIYTGQRNVTICNIKLSDISSYMQKTKKDKMTVTIIARVTIGNKAFNQPYIIEGNPELKNKNDAIMNFIYWLNENLKNYYGLDLNDIKNWPKEKIESKFYKKTTFIYIIQI
jgi:hypothetical protein